MIKVFEIILCMSLKTISPDVPRCGRSLHLYVLFITDQYKKKYWEAILVGKCCHCRIKSFTHPLHFSMILARTVPAKLYVRIFRVLSVKYTKPVLKSFLLQKYAKGAISPRHQDWHFKRIAKIRTLSTGHYRNSLVTILWNLRT